MLRHGPIADLKEPTALKAYLAIVARNLAIVELRKHHASFTRHGISDDVVGMEQSPELEVELKDLLDFLLTDETPRDQELFKLLLAGHSLDDVAQQMGLTYTNVGVMLYRMRRRLQDRFGKL
jgi:RNA polymerase sigma factor (sigma-70 family)